jgi:hypothetical protein
VPVSPNLMTGRDGSGVRAYTAELVREMQAQWVRNGKILSDLPKIAAKVLREIPAPGFRAGEVLTYLATEPTGSLPTQSGFTDNFGQPPAILYASEDFFIQALTWMEGTTAIHQHGFSGAFRVIDGQSLHVGYSFDVSEVLSPQIQIGHLDMVAPEILNVGDVRAIEPGSAFIHALFHLVRPSVTIVIRNFKTDVGAPQFNYRNPGVASAPPDRNVLRYRRLQAIGALHGLEPDKALRAAGEITASEDTWGALQVADHCFGLWGWSDRFITLLEDLGKHHGALGEIAPIMYEEQWRSDGVLRRRTLLHEPHQRTFLALLANLPTRGAIDSVLGQLVPDRPSDEVLMEWIEELSSAKLRGVSGLSLTDDERAELRIRLRGDSLADSLGTLSTKFSRPSLLDHLIF